MVIAKPYFDAAGLILAIDDNGPLGFVHAAFGPAPQRNDIDSSRGAVAMLLVRPSSDETAIATALVERAESYLRGRGAQTILGGCCRPVDPFYLGMYGGSELRGVLAADRRFQSFLSANGYVESDRTAVMQLDLAKFRPLVDRRQMQARRRLTIDVIAEPKPNSWWEACTYGGFDRVAYRALPRDGGPPVASATTWNMLPISNMWGVHAMGLIDVEVQPGQRRQGAATFLFGELLRHLHTLGASVAEIQVPMTNTATRALCQKLGFTLVDEAVKYVKGDPAAAAIVN